MLTVTGCASPISSTRTRVQAVLSNSKGKSTHHPWLMTVRRKLKFGGVGMASFIITFQNNQIAKKQKIISCTHQVQSTWRLTDRVLSAKLYLLTKMNGRPYLLAPNTWFSAREESTPRLSTAQRA